jgi:hypothetical protein
MLFWKFHVTSQDATLFYCGHAGYSIEVSPPHTPPSQTHINTTNDTHTAPAIRSVASIIHSNFPALFHLQRPIHSDLRNVSYTYILPFVLRRHDAPSDSYFVGKWILSLQLQFHNKKYLCGTKRLMVAGIIYEDFSKAGTSPTHIWYLNVKKSFWEEIVAYFTLIRQEPYRKRGENRLRCHRHGVRELNDSIFARQ